MNTERSWGERFGIKVEALLQRYTPDALSLLAVAATAIASLPNAWGGPLLWIGIGLVIGLTAVAVRNKTRESFIAMKDSRDDAITASRLATHALSEAIKPLARNLHQYLDLSSADQRLSVYLHHESEFILVARVAQDPNLRKAGRPRYPDHQGVIGTVWSAGDAIVRIGKAESWESWCSRFGFSPDETAHLSMKSQSIAAVRLDFQHESVGIILLESERPRGISVDQFEKLQSSYISQSLAEVLAIVKPHLATPA